MGATPAVAFSQEAFEMFQPGVLDELETPAERRRRVTNFNMDEALRSAIIAEEQEEELLLPDEILDCLATAEMVEDRESLEHQVARDLVYSLTPIQVDVVRRIVLEVEDMNAVAKSYGVSTSEISLAVSCALDVVEPWRNLPCIDRLVKLGRRLGF